MIAARRQAFNQSWSEAGYERLLSLVGSAAGSVPGFPIAETPCFFTREFIDGLARTGAELVNQLEGNPAAMAAASQVVPERFTGPGEDPVPRFVQVDFGLVRTADGRIEPRLVELQAFASLYGLQRVMADAYRDAFGLPAFDIFLGGHNQASYEAVVGSAILGGHDPVEVVLMEIEPRWQKTWPDFAVTENTWGVRAIDVSAVRREGRQLFYDRDGRRVRIRRIYNRVIPDELDRKGIELPFDYRDDLEVEWAGHPAWYFRISKFSIPWLRHPSVPRTWFLHELAALPDDRENYVLKPLYSFAGGGIVFGPTDADIAAIPADDRMNYILQERIAFTPIIETPYGPTQVEIRIMYVWTDQLRPVLPLLRMGRGRMMGVDHNKGLRWVGASAALIEDPR